MKPLPSQPLHGADDALLPNVVDDLAADHLLAIGQLAHVVGILKFANPFLRCRKLLAYWQLAVNKGRHVTVVDAGDTYGLVMRDNGVD